MSSLSSIGGSSSALTSPFSTSSSTSAPRRPPRRAARTSPGTGALSISGLVSGLNTSQIIQAELAVQQQQITSVQAQQSALTQKETAYNALQAQLLTLQSNVTQLADPVNGPFDGRTATTSSPSVVTAAAASNAVAGVYSFTVNSLAQASEIASQGFASASSQITQGTVVVGSGNDTATITVGSTNNTLQGLAAAINNANVGVNASVVNVGQGSQPYRLLLSATQTGTANAVTIDTTGLSTAVPTSGAVQPTFGVNPAVASSNNQGTAAVTSGGTYTGTANDTFTFTVQSVTGGGDLSQGGTVTLAYANANNTQTGTLNLSASDLNQFQNVAEGVQIAVGAGPLAVGDQFTVGTTVATVQQAADASVTLGSGSGALTVTNASNTVNTAITGVTLNLLAPSGGNPVQLTVGTNTSTAQTAIQNFVTDYNSVISTVASDVSYDASTNTAGVLLGDPSIQNIQDQLQNLVLQPVNGANPKLNNLAALGITIDASGQLQVDSTTLNNVLSGDVSGVTLNDVRTLFAVGGTSTNAGVTFVNATSATKASATPYGVVVTQAARQATLQATSALGPNTAITAGNNSFVLTVNGIASNTLTVPPSSGPGYTQQALVQAVQSAINADSNIGSQDVVVGIQNNELTFTTGTYGSSSTAAIGTASFLGFDSPATATGQDVAGSFLVNGQAEAATGSGQLLTGNSGNANTDGLAVNVTLLPSQISPATSTPVASLTVTQGLAAQLGTALNNLTDPTTGQIQIIDKNFQEQITAYQTQINLLQQQYNAQEAALTTEFNNMETTLSNLKNASNFISAQTNALQTLSGFTTASTSVGPSSSASTGA